MKQEFRDTIKEPKYVTVTPKMIMAGVERLEELWAELLTDRHYVVEAVYGAMELERRRRAL